MLYINPPALQIPLAFNVRYQLCGLDPSGLEGFFDVFSSAEWSLTQMKKLYKFAANDSFIFIFSRKPTNS